MSFENFKQNNPEMVYGPENTFNEVAPNLALVKKDANVSYQYHGEIRERYTDLYKDDRGNEWFEIRKMPRRQQTISLLAQPFFNISTIIEVPGGQGRMSKFLEHLNPNIRLLLGLSPIASEKKTKFLSKKLDLEKTTPKDIMETVADFIVYTQIFEPGFNDRSWEGQNFRKTNSSYALFDFEHSSILPRREGARSSLNVIDDIGWMSGSKEGADKIRVVDHIIDKLKKIAEFYSGESGESFFGSVLKKTGYLDHLSSEHFSTEKYGSMINADTGKFDDSFKNPSTYYKTLLQRIKGASESVLSGLEKHTEILIDDTRIKELKEIIDSVGQNFNKIDS